MRSNYDLYEYRVPSTKDYFSQEEARAKAIANNYACFLKITFLSDGRKFSYSSSYLNPIDNTFHDFFSTKFSTLSEIKHFSRWFHKRKSVPILIRRIK